MDPKVKTDFLISGREESEISIADAATSASLNKERKVPRTVSPSASATNRSISAQEEPTISGRDRSSLADPCPKESNDKGRRSSANLRYSAGKKKVKLDWTPELHEKFVQAVEKLGIDKAVPSRILELMGVDCLTRHNVASHLQKYRSHRKHMLSREAEALSWSRRRQMHCSASNARTGRRDTNPSNVARTGFPQVTPPLHHHHRPPLHVWGHPSVDQSLMYMWPNQPRDHTPWSWHQNVGFVENTVSAVPAPGFPCVVPPYLAATKMTTPIVPGTPGTSMYRVDSCVGVPAVPSGQALPRQPFDFYASKERIDAVIGDVLSKPWLPLPLGLKPPSVDSVIVELQRQGISKIPPTTFA